jgi:DNA-binding response OmpR family regulator
MSSSNPLVLVADDEPSMLELVARHLKTMADPKLEVIEASDGEQAWRLAREHLPDLVVLDVMMPGMSGWEVCRKIREDVALAHTGVVMLTGIGENLNQMTSPLYGADDYIDKPFEFNELDSKVKTALKRRATQREGVDRPVMNGVGGHAKKASAKKAKSKAAAKETMAAPATKKIAKTVAKVVKVVKKIAAKVVKKASAAKAPAKKAAAKVAKVAKKAAKKPMAAAAKSKKAAPKKAAAKKSAKKSSKK